MSYWHQPNNRRFSAPLTHVTRGRSAQAATAASAVSVTVIFASQLLHNCYMTAQLLRDYCTADNKTLTLIIVPSPTMILTSPRMTSPRMTPTVNTSYYRPTILSCPPQWCTQLPQVIQTIIVRQSCRVPNDTIFVRQSCHVLNDDTGNTR